MEIDTSYGKIKIKNLLLALIPIGVIVIVVPYFLPPEVSEQVGGLLRLIGILLILVSVCIITAPYLIELANK